MDLKAPIEALVKAKGKYISQDCYELRDANGHTWYVLLDARGPDGEYKLGYGSPQYCVKSPERKTPEQFLAFMETALSAT